MCDFLEIITIRPHCSGLTLGDKGVGECGEGKKLAGKSYKPQQMNESLCPSERLCVSYRIVECRPRVMPLPVMGDGKVLPPCRSSIERLQGFDLSIIASGLFSTRSPSNLLHRRKTTLYTSIYRSSYLVYIEPESLVFHTHHSSTLEAIPEHSCIRL